MAGWAIAGKNDTVPSDSHFRSRSHCSLVVSPATKGQPLPQAELRDRFGRACAHSGCPKCGPLQAQRLLLPFASSLDHIKGPVTHMVLRGPIVDIGQAGLLPLRQFLDASRLFALMLQQGLFGEFDVWVLASEFAPMNVSQVRPHLHFPFARTHFGLLPLTTAIVEAWIMMGGEWQGGPACTFGGDLSRTLRYLAKGPLGKHYESPAGEACANYLLDRFEHTTRAPATVYYRGGTLVDPLIRRASQARARIEQCSESAHTQDHLGLVRDKILAESLPTRIATLDVEHSVRCPGCRRSGRLLTRHGRDAHGHQRWRCKNCSSTFRDRPISQKQAEHFERLRLAALIRRLVDRDGLPMSKAARIARIGRQRAQHVYDWHFRRWPKKAPLQ